MLLMRELATQQQPDHVIPFKKNWEALADLQEENARLAAGWGIATTGAAACLYLTAPLVATGGIAAGVYYQWRATKVLRLIESMNLLLETFEGQGIEVYPRLPVAGQNPIDLFVRFPKTTHLFISIRSKGERQVVYNTVREILQTRKRKGEGLQLWNPSPLLELAGYEKWLDKNRGLFGFSSREASKTPTAKVLLLWPPTTAGRHREELYSQVGDTKLLALRRKGTAFVIEKEELISFVLNG